jgi:parallel beta-helix repeat protein
MLLLGWSWAAAAASFHVAPDGNDDWKGDWSHHSWGNHGPFKSVARALAATQALQNDPNFAEDVTVYLAAGRHELSAPLEFTHTIWKSPGGHRLVVEGASDGSSEISGGILLRGWKANHTNSALWSVALPEQAGKDWQPHQLILQGRRLQRARSPNTGFYQMAGNISKSSPFALPYRPVDASQLTPSPGGWLIVLMKWTDFHLPFREIDTVHQRIPFPGGPCPEFIAEPDARYWIENNRSALDQPGEWIYEPDSKALSLLAAPGIDPNKEAIVVSRWPALIKLQGDGQRAEFVRNVTFRNLAFTDADYEMPADGMISPQAAVAIHGAIRSSYSKGINIENCEFKNCGGHAIDLGRACQNWRVVGNEMHELGGGGIRIGEEDGPDDPVHGTYGTQFTDNHLYALGRIFAPACGVLVFRSGTNTIAHNHIHDLYYTAISVGWQWGYATNACRGNLVAYNHLHDIGQGRLSDMGGVYTLGPQPGTVVRNNLIHDVQSYQYGGWGLYTDEGSTGIVMENNVVYRCTDAGFHQHYGKDNVIRNNLLVDSRHYSVMRTREENHRSFWFTHNIIVATSGDFLGSNWNGQNFVSDNNVWFDTRVGGDVAKYRFAGQGIAGWRFLHHDENSILADPLLVDLEHPEKGLRKNSPAYRLGYQAIDLKKVGPRRKYYPGR